MSLNLFPHIHSFSHISPILLFSNENKFFAKNTFSNNNKDHKKTNQKKHKKNTLID